MRPRCLNCGHLIATHLEVLGCTYTGKPIGKSTDFCGCKDRVEKPLSDATVKRHIAALKRVAQELEG